MAKIRITRKNRNEYARKICEILDCLDLGEWMTAEELCEKTGLTLENIRVFVRWIKDCSRHFEYEKYIRWYVIPSGKGYALLKNVSLEDATKSYRTQKTGSIAKIRRMDPLERYLNENGIDPDFINEEPEEYSEYEIEQYKAFNDYFGNDDEDLKARYWHE